MSERVAIALACTRIDERATVVEWLAGSGYDPVAIPDLGRLHEDLQSKPIQALIADLALIPREDDLRGLVRRLGSNRPLMVLGDAGRLPASTRVAVSVISRPLSREGVVLSVGLALAEGRHARRYPRRFVDPVRAVAHGIHVIVREVSPGGVGVELVGPSSSVLPPYFKLRIPELGVHVLVKRAWMASSGDVMKCGGTIERDMPGAAWPWAEFARDAPALNTRVTDSGTSGIFATVRRPGFPFV